MKRIEEKFARLKKNGSKALVAYLTAGYPDLETTGELVSDLDGAGVDILELGIPFSDPTADGPAIQEASHRALLNGTTLPRVLDLLRVLRKSTEMPIIFFSYYNPIFVFGNRRFSREAAAAGADGVLVVDLPLEEAEELRKFTAEAGLAFIPLVAPTTGARRMEQIARDASGFIYYVSLTGITGTGSPVLEELQNNVARIKSKTKLPVAAGFGISTPAQAREIAAAADGVVVGSAFIRLIGEGGDRRKIREAVHDLAKSLKEALL
jgi:tryptophan synthase alpha chain